MSIYKDGYWWSSDGLRLHYRDYAGGEDGRPPLLCLPGLTRNARDFEPLANRLAGQWRVICLDLRGRAESAQAKDPMTYVPLTYLQDVGRLVEELNLDRFVAVGTSLGGLITMLIAATNRQWLAGAVLNDVGPELDAKGLGRIRTYVGVSQSHPSWVHAARVLEDTNRDVYPRYGMDQWLAMAKRLYRLNGSGRVVLDYDMRIAEPIKAMGDQPEIDMWPIMGAFKEIPTLILRGERSDLFSAATGRRMVEEIGDNASFATVSGVGHTPVLDEPEAVTAIDALLSKVLHG